MRHPSQPLPRPASFAFLTLAVLCSAASLIPSNSRFVAAAQSANTGSCTPPPNDAISQSEIAQFESVESGIKDREAQANHDYETDKLRCKADSNPHACLVTAGKKYQNAEVKIQEDRDTNDTNRQKAEIDAGAARDQCNVTGATPAIKQENLRHFKVLVDLQKKNADVQLSYKIAKLECQLYSADSIRDSGGAKSSDKYQDENGQGYDYSVKRSGCTREAEKAYKANQINLQIATSDEDFLHTKNLNAIQKQQP